MVCGHLVSVDNVGLRGCPVRRGEVMAELYDSWCRQLRANGDRLGEGEDCLLLFYTPGSELLQSRAAGGHSMRRGDTSCLSTHRGQSADISVF